MVNPANLYFVSQDAARSTSLDETRLFADGTCFGDADAIQ